MERRLSGLSSLKNGQSGTIVKIGVEGKLRRRFVELGLTPGTRVAVVKRAPLGDPIEIRLRGCELVLRTCDAERILVIPEQS